MTIETTLMRCEAKIDLILALLKGQEEGREEREIGNKEVFAALSKLTTRQHGALQMILRGASNRDIAERFGVGENTAKVYVREVARKLGVRTRAQIVAKVYEEMRLMDERSYEAMSGGLPLDWDAEYERPDKWAGVFGSRSDGGKTG